MFCDTYMLHVTCFVTHICYMWHVLWHIYVTCDMFCNKFIVKMSCHDTNVLQVTSYVTYVYWLWHVMWHIYYLCDINVLQLTCYVTSICYMWRVMWQINFGRALHMNAYVSCNMLLDIVISCVACYVPCMWWKGRLWAITWYMAHTHTHTQPTHPSTSTHTRIHTHVHTHTQPGNPYWRGRLNTVELLVLASLEQLVFVYKILITFVTKQATLMRM